MGKGDKKSKKGKIKMGSYGNSRMKSANNKSTTFTSIPKSETKTVEVEKAKTPKKTAKKTKAKEIE